MHPSNTCDVDGVTLELHPGVLELPCDTHPVVCLTPNITRKFVVRDLNGLHCTVVCMVSRIQFVSKTINIVSDNISNSETAVLNSYV